MAESRITEALEDGEARNPLKGLFVGLEVRSLDEIAQEVQDRVGLDLKHSIAIARNKAEDLEDDFGYLSEDERAILTLYSMEDTPKERSFYFEVNKCLRARDRDLIKPWRDAIWLLLTAMQKLPRCESAVLFRGVKKSVDELGKQCKVGKTFLWCGFTSTAEKSEGVNNFVGTSGPRTLWNLQLRKDFRGVSLAPFSLFPKEHEVLLPPQLNFKVVSVLPLGHELSMVQCEQVPELDPIVDFAQAVPAVAAKEGGYTAAQAAAAPAGPQMDAKAWLELGVKGGGTVAGVSYTEKQCYLRALEIDANYAYAWNNLGYVGGGQVQGVSYTKQQCHIRALEIDAKNAYAWNNLATIGGGQVQGVSYTAAQCFLRALEIDANFAKAWINLGAVGGGQVQGVTYTAAQCYLRALEINANYAAAWSNLGNAGGGEVQGVTYTAAQCYLRALEIDANLAQAWNNLGDVGGGQVQGVSYTQKQCSLRALEIDPNFAHAWNNLGEVGGGQVQGVSYTQKQCYEKSLELNPKVHPIVWRNLASIGGGTVAGVAYTAAECVRRAWELE